MKVFRHAGIGGENRGKKGRIWKKLSGLIDDFPLNSFRYKDEVSKIRHHKMWVLSWEGTLRKAQIYLLKLGGWNFQDQI